MSIAILDPFSGISGDMTLGALLAVGLDPKWLESLPATLKLDGVTVQIKDVRRSGIACKKVDFDIPPQPHGRHVKQIHAMVEAAPIPERVRVRAHAAFDAIATVEAEMHGTTVEKVHLHEVGAVDAILDVVGSVWGFDQLGVREIYCGAISLGDGTVHAAHGELPVPAPATLKLLEGHPVRPGPTASGELVTPTGAALVRVLSSGPPPKEFIPRRSGFGAGTKEFEGRPNALRVILADASADGAGVEHLVMLSADVDDITGEHLTVAAHALRDAGALDVIMMPTVMKKGRPGIRVEVLSTSALAHDLEDLLLTHGVSIGVRRYQVERRALARRMQTVTVLGRLVRVKTVIRPDGAETSKPELDDIRALAASTGRTAAELSALAIDAANSDRAT